MILFMASPLYSCSLVNSEQVLGAGHWLSKRFFITIVLEAEVVVTQRSELMLEQYW